MRTKFSFEILSFYESPLERQIGEAVRIDITGAERILNSKAAYSRSKVPRIIALDQEEEIPLGDREELIELVDDVDEQNELGQEEVEVMLTGRALQKSLARNNRKQKVRDLLLWGIQGHGELEDGEVAGDTNENEDEAQETGFVHF